MAYVKGPKKVTDASCACDKKKTNKQTNKQQQQKELENFLVYIVIRI